MKGSAYIAAIGRENDYPPVVASLLDEARRKGHAYSVTPLFHDRQYVGYTVTVYVDQREVSVDVTGGASRFVPQSDRASWDLDDQRNYMRAFDWDAPPESGRFAGGLEATATQTNGYAQRRAQRSER